MRALLLLAVLLAPRDSVTSFTPVHDLTFDSLDRMVSYAHDDRYDYLGTPERLFRSEDLLDPAKPLERIGFADRPIGALAMWNGALYVLTGESQNYGYSAEHTLFRYDGFTFLPVGHDLRVCNGETCGYLSGRHLQVSGGNLYVEAGERIFVANDDGTRWRMLYDGWYCDIVFSVSAQQMLIGGGNTCISMIAGTLRADGRGWLNEPADTNRSMDDHSIYAFRHVGSNTVFAGTQYGLFRSDDGGRTFRGLWRRPPGTGTGLVFAPTIKHIFASSTNPDVLLAGGPGNLSYSPNGGDSWFECHSILASIEDTYPIPPHIELIAENRDGEIIAVVRYRDRYVVGQVNLGASKRRVAGR